MSGHWWVLIVIGIVILGVILYAFLGMAARSEAGRAARRKEKGE